MVSLLHERGGDIGAPEEGTGDTPLILAVKGKHLAVVKFLLEKCADAEVENGLGEKAMDVAVREGTFQGLEMKTLLGKAPLQKCITTITE